MHQYSPYVLALEETLFRTLLNPSSTLDQVKQSLDGQASSELRRLIPKNSLRGSGAFFTSRKLGNIAISNEFISSITIKSSIIDPACGGGDLLLLVTPSLQRTKDLNETLALWESNLVGIDLYPEFIKTTKLRLILKAITLGANPIKNVSDSYNAAFKNIIVGSIFEQLELLKNATHILLNPPYNMVQASESCDWAHGKVNAASIFLEICIKNAQAGTRIAAILPDVLRSGTRYKKWRQIIETHCDIKRLQLYGQFDAWTDIDVFVIELIVKEEVSENTFAWSGATKRGGIIVGDVFSLSIGPVVDYRDPHSGPSTKFLRPHGLPAWISINKLDNDRLFAGRTYKGPFVVVRRTSRRGDKYRAIGTIINTQEKVAVENHLIVLIPKDGKISTCQDLLDNLLNEKTTQWLDETIRCRHLTIQSLADLPLWGTRDDNR
jgi:N-6 DNA Methylase